MFKNLASCKTCPVPAVLMSYAFWHLASLLFRDIYHNLSRKAGESQKNSIEMELRELEGEKKYSISSIML